MDSLDDPPHIRSRELVDLAMHLSSLGLVDSENALICGVAVKTIRRWRRLYVRRGVPRGGGGTTSPPCPRCDERTLDEAAYSALLGFYLGDGHIALARGRSKSTLRLDIVQDQRYPDSVQEIKRIVERVKVGKAGLRPKQGCIAITSVWLHWPCLFPQHGEGRKHERLIELTDWQRAIVEREPHAFLRGLFHSDGCRANNWVQKTKSNGEKVRRYYPRYMFSNKSDDIRGLCVWALGLLGIPCKDDGKKVVTVNRREAVAVLDSFIGPKS